jgi:pantothenate kinase
MSGLVHAVFGGGPQDEMIALQKKQQADQDAVAAGQAKLRAGGGAGLLAYTGDSGASSAGGADLSMGAVRGLNKLLSGAS